MSDYFLKADAAAPIVPIRRVAGVERLSLLDFDGRIDFSSDCFLACPSSTFLQREAKFKEHIVSPRLYTAGEILTNIRHLLLPPKESCKNIVK